MGRRRRAGELLIAWGASLVLLPRTGDGTNADVLAALAWLSALVVVHASERRAAWIGSIAGGALVCALWMAAPAAYPLVAAVLVAFALAALAVDAAPSDRRSHLAFVGIAVVPTIISGVVWLVGDEQGRQMVRYDWQLPDVTLATVSIAARTFAVVAAVFAGLDARTTHRAKRLPMIAVAVAACLVLVVKIGTHAATLASAITLPEDAGWSESAALANLLKLRLGLPLFAPFEDCSSYSYAPTLEIVHHALLSPFGLDLALVANRILALGWQLVTASIFAITLGRLFGERWWRVLVIAGSVLVATSSFLAPHLHPDHLLLPWFALALGLAVHAPRLSPRIVTAGLVVLPITATLVKLTGAGVGLGLALAFGLPLRRRTAAALAAGAAGAVFGLFAYDRLEPRFWQYTFKLQASHRVQWGEIGTIFVEPAGRAFLIALVMFGALHFVRDDDARETRRAVRRVLLVSIGFALPSAIAFLKVGGRENSLLPLSFGAWIACGCVVAFVLRRAAANDAAARAFAGAAAAALVLTVAALDRVIPRELRDAVRERHARMVEYVAGETAAGRRPVIPQSTAAWIDAGRRDLAGDRWQMIGELGLGGHPEARVCRERIVSAAYDSVIIDKEFLDPHRSPATAPIAPVLERDYDLVADEPIPGGLVPSVRLYRRKPAPAP